MTDHIAPDGYVFPASAGQERLWFLAQMNEAASRAYGIAVRLDLRGTLDRTALQLALNAVLARHEALRTGLREVDGTLVQVVEPGVTVPLSVVEVTDAGLERLLRREARRGWRLAQPPLLRCLLARVSEEHHVLLVSVHHAVCDGLSLQTVLQELLECYLHIGTGAGDPWTEPPTQFADYVVWSNGGRTDDRDQPDPGWVAQRQAARAYWTGALRGAPDVLELPLDLRRPPLPSYDGAQVPVRLAGAVAERVREWSARAGVTPSATLLSAFAVVLARCSGSDDLLVGLPVANHARPDLAGTVGYLANTCPLRADLRSDPPIGELVRQVHGSLTGMLDHASLPFGELVELLAPARMLDRNPVFQVMFGLQQDVRRRYDLPGLRVDIDEVDCGNARVDLSLFLFEERDGAIAGFLEYASALFHRSTVERFAGQLAAVLDQLLDDAEVPVSAVRLAGAVPPADHGGPLDESWSMVWPQVRRMAQARPDAVSVRDDTEALSYRALVARATAAGDRLRAAGVRSADRVVVHTDRSVAALVAILACWRIGAVYVPIDPDGPQSRRQLILEAADPTAVLCPDPAALPSGYRSRAIPWPALAGTPSIADGPAAEPVAVSPDHLAYLMFTSGSTGRPKGVAVSHRNLVSFLHALTDQLGLAAEDQLLALTTTAFDISLLELLGPLVTGGTVAVAPASAQRDGSELAGRLGDPALTMAQATPAGWRLAVNAGWRPRPGFRVLCGGEALPPDLADLLSRTPAVVHNLYGPTETTIWSCATRVRRGEAVTIGRPIPGTHTLVVDSALAPVPVGVCGELLIGGPGVALGYLGQPRLTAARFLPDPELAGQRLYRTGDLVRRRADGAMEFVGRADEQVKLRGHRIELGEIESVLRGLDGVRDAAATVLDPRGHARIAGYLVAEPEPAVAASGAGWPAAVRRAAAELLPSGMVPAELYQVPAIPLNPNGKVDRRMLAGLGRRLETSIEPVAPRSEAERSVAALWHELLGVAQIGVTDDFFAHGGHSLLAAQLIQRVERDLGVRVPMAEFFVEPTIARIAATVGQRRGEVTRPPPGGRPGSPDLAEPAADRRPAAGDWDFPAVRRATTTGRTATAALPEEVSP